jgi:hypothetical protein
VFDEGEDDTVRPSEYNVTLQFKDVPKVVDKHLHFKNDVYIPPEEDMYDRDNNIFEHNATEWIYMVGGEYGGLFDVSYDSGTCQLHGAVVDGTTKLVITGNSRELDDPKNLATINEDGTFDYFWTCEDVEERNMQVFTTGSWRGKNWENVQGIANYIVIEADTELNWTSNANGEKKIDGQPPLTPVMPCSVDQNTKTVEIWTEDDTITLTGSSYSKFGLYSLSINGEEVTEEASYDFRGLDRNEHTHPFTYTQALNAEGDTYINLFLNSPSTSRSQVEQNIIVHRGVMPLSGATPAQATPNPTLAGTGAPVGVALLLLLATLAVAGVTAAAGRAQAILSRGCGIQTRR